MIRSPMSLPAGALFSESAIARARNAYNAGPALRGALAFRCESIASKRTGKTTVAKGRVALRRIASATATRIEEAGRNAVALESLEKLLQVLYGHASTRSASGDSGHIGSVKAEFGHAGLHSGRQIRGACRRRRHRQSFDGRFDLTWAGGHGLALGFLFCEMLSWGFPRVPIWRLPRRRLRHIRGSLRPDSSSPPRRESRKDGRCRARSPP